VTPRRSASSLRDRLDLVLTAMRGDAAVGDAFRELLPDRLRRARRAPLTMRYEPGAPILVLSPHLDDAVFSCWSVLTSPADVQVVNVYAGVPKTGFVTHWDRIMGATESAAFMRERVAEDREALGLAGRRPINLGFLESQYRWAAASVSRLTRALGDSVLAGSRIYAPAALGGHADHRLVRTLGFELARNGPPLSLYADLPYAVSFGWPSWVTGAEPDPRVVPDAHWRPHLDSAPCRRDALRARVHESSEDEALAKLEAMRAYRTQFPAVSGGGLNAMTRLDVVRYEVYWDVRGAF
jgi:LmbE family N-acetylglucosaminyl deacetylase